MAVCDGLGEGDKMKKPPDPHHRHRFPADLISHAVSRVQPELSGVELLLVERGVIVSYDERLNGIRRISTRYETCNKHSGCPPPNMRS